MTPKEKLLSIDNYEELKRRWSEFGDLMPDTEIIEHLSKIFPKSPNPKEELYRFPKK